MMGGEVSDYRIITCHLGNGSSVAAVKYGKSIDTSMGYTPLDGLVMGTRSGEIDPAIIPFLIVKENMDAEQIDEYLNRRSGVLGRSAGFPVISGIWKARRTAAMNAASWRLTFLLTA